MSVRNERVLRVVRSRDVARRSYDRMSRWYDKLAAPSEWKHTRLALDMLAAREGERVLEIGFGTGDAVLALAKDVGRSGSVCGIDISHGMLMAALRKLERAEFGASVRLECGDGADLPYGAGEFDAVFMSFTLELFDTPEIAGVLQECHRVLKPDGRMAVVSMVKQDKDNLAVRLYEWAHRVLPEYIDCRPILLRSALEDNGFVPMKVCERKMWGLPIEVVVAART